MDITENIFPSTSPAVQPRFDTSLLALLACPVTKTVLTYDEANQELISRQAGLAFPIRNGIPILLKEDARILSETAPPALTPS